MKDINQEIYKLKAIKYEVERLEMFKRSLKNELHFLSQAKYDELAANNELNEDDFYYIVEPEIGQYMKGYMDIERF